MASRWSPTPLVTRLLIAAAIAGSACTQILDLTDPIAAEPDAAPDTTATSDGRLADDAAPDAGTDGSAAPDASPDAAIDAMTDAPVLPDATIDAGIDATVPVRAADHALGAAIPAPLASLPA